jgi:hypothetical protein
MTGQQQPSCYYLKRERSERQAAEASVCPAAKLAHERLADLYAEQARRPADPASSRPDGEAVSNLVILSRN